MGLDEAGQAEPVRRSENNTHDIQGTETIHAAVPRHSVDPKCIPNPFIPDAPCDTSVEDQNFGEQNVTVIFLKHWVTTR